MAGLEEEDNDLNEREDDTDQQAGINPNQPKTPKIPPKEFGKKTLTKIEPADKPTMNTAPPKAIKVRVKNPGFRALKINVNKPNAISGSR